MRSDHPVLLSERTVRTAKSSEIETNCLCGRRRLHGSCFHGDRGVTLALQVLVESFGAKNVSSVPSILGPPRCQMVQVRDA
jgi:hypothetical protein